MKPEELKAQMEQHNKRIEDLSQELKINRSQIHRILSGENRIKGWAKSALTLYFEKLSNQQN